MPSFTLQRSRIPNCVTISPGLQSLHLDDLKVLANLSTGLSCRHIEHYRHGNMVHKNSGIHLTTIPTEYSLPRFIFRNMAMILQGSKSVMRC